MLYTGMFSPGAGYFLASLRPCLLAQGWASLGFIAPNNEVFFSNGTTGNETIYVQVNDVTAGIIYFRAGSGYTPAPPTLNNPTSPRYFETHATNSMSYWYFVTKDRFVVVVKNYKTNPYAFCYVGLLNRYLPVQLLCVLVTGASTGTGIPIGAAHGNTFSGGLGNLVQVPSGAYNRTMNATALNANFGALQLPNPIDGKMLISPILIGNPITEIHGELLDVFSIAGAGIASEDVLTKGADVYTCFIISTNMVCIKN